MSSILDNIESERDNFEQLLDKLPGYKGYKEKELRRESDMVVRQALADQLAAMGRRLPPIQSDLVDAGRLDMNSLIATTATVLQTLADKIKAAPKGHTGLFSAVRVKEADLDALQAFDEELGKDIPAISAAIGALDRAVETDGDVRGANRLLRQTIDAMQDTFNKRSAVITGV
ncbi:MAG TPA: hypothetical protein PLJ62_04920 [Thermoflexales bacterium]|nr:hypothetical protein [Thermoflexales bacterium]HQW34608.1 hypothetical protein [Thermoflexales bacterium]HQX75575.1 hypothetical protein [Thermoflexales bacterium]HQZ21519.1 hypothetical protein [Thermoflexales bacterium]HQZ99520.1 hypothetical protein [Thermoflexales bacterium]